MKVKPKKIIIVGLLTLLILVTGCTKTIPTENCEDYCSSWTYFISKNCTETELFMEYFEEENCIESVDNWICKIDRKIER